LEKISEEDRQHVNIFKFSYGRGRLKEYTRKIPLFCRHEEFTYKGCSGTILGFNDYGWKSGTPIE
jgi:hypothetical protein